MKLFTELVHSIYPIEMVSSAAVGSSATVRSEAGAEEGPCEEEYTIRGIELPMVIDTRCDVELEHDYFTHNLLNMLVCIV